MLPETVAPQVVVSGTTLRYPVGPGVLLAEVGQFSDELSAYLQFDYIRSRPDVDEAAVFLEANETAHGPDYRVTILAPNDAVTAIPYLAGLEARAIISGFKLVATPAYRIPYLRQQTAIFVSAYNRPVRPRNDVDLIVMGKIGRRGARRILVGSITRGVIECSDRAVLVITGPPRQPLPPSQD